MPQADVAQWRAAREEFFRSDGVSELLGRAPVIDDDTLVVAERFRWSNPTTRGDPATEHRSQRLIICRIAAWRCDLFR